MKPITCDGFWSVSTKSYLISLGPIFSYLIRECGRLVDDYNADILYDFSKIEDYATKVNYMDTKTKVFWLGFRECGVDHEEFIKYRIDGYHYRAIYKVTVVKNSRKSVVTLERSDDCEFKTEHGIIA